MLPHYKRMKVYPSMGYAFFFLQKQITISNLFICTDRLHAKAFLFAQTNFHSKAFLFNLKQITITTFYFTLVINNSFLIVLAFILKFVEIKNV